MFDMRHLYIYEYKVIKTGFHDSEVEINSLAKQGNRAVGVSPNIAAGHLFFVVLEKKRNQNSNISIKKFFHKSC